MSSTLSDFARRLHAFIGAQSGGSPGPDSFDALASDLFRLQFAANEPYRRLCQSRRLGPEQVRNWRDIPAVPTSAFKEFELTSLAPAQRTAVFHSSGTTEQRPSRHYHSTESLALYEASLAPWFRQHLLPDAPRVNCLALTPPAEAAPHSSLAHMFTVVLREFGTGTATFAGLPNPDGWTLDFPAAHPQIEKVISTGEPLLVLGTAFSFVHLVDALAKHNLRLILPAGSRVMETGGYKGRSRTLPRAELHRLITRHLGVPASHIICEYGMSELSSQAYDAIAGTQNSKPETRNFLFPPWARATVVSPETGREVPEGETGLLRICDLANVWSVMAVQTEDLALRRGDGFELLGRAFAAEPRGCSLMAT